MGLSRKALNVGATTILVMGSLVGTAAAASAAPQGVVCDTGNERVYQTSSTDRYVGNEDNRVYGASGGAISVNQGETWTTSGSVTGTVTAEAGAIFASASASVGITVGLSQSSTAGSSYTWTVPPEQATGWVEKGNHGYDVSWTYGYYQEPCTWIELDSGTGVGVTGNVEYAHS